MNTIRYKIAAALLWVAQIVLPSSKIAIPASLQLRKALEQVKRL